ncbi:SSI family serine proteinase inhibitor [Streptomyces sp. NPDC093260]|uniref:SSI family serine proteinase inhibitor n=1 Tax=Streptomyces sp. NPDC093260 TaxID=3155073 RepID=UPI0034350FC0
MVQVSSSSSSGSSSPSPSASTASSASSTPSVSPVRLLVRAVVSAGACAALTALFAGAAAAGAGAPPPLRDEDRAGDHLTVTVRDAGDGRDGTYELSCHPAYGSHPDARGACTALDRNTRWGRDTFAPVPDGTVCTLQYGGPATARVTGVWAGRPVDALYTRGNGCEIARWRRLVPLLPDLG